MKPDWKPDWKDAPEWATHLAMDDDGTWHWFANEPEYIGPKYLGDLGKWSGQVRLRAMPREVIACITLEKKQIHEDLKNEVEREWVGLTDEERSKIHNDFIHKKIGIWEVCDFCEAKLKEKNA